MNASPENSHPSRHTSASAACSGEPPLTKRMIPSQELLAGEKEIWIRHGDAIYRLCETKSGKLILQK